MSAAEASRKPSLTKGPITKTLLSQQWRSFSIMLLENGSRPTWGMPFKA